MKQINCQRKIHFWYILAYGQRRNSYWEKKIHEIGWKVTIPRRSVKTLVRGNVGLKTLTFIISSYPLTRITQNSIFYSQSTCRALTLPFRDWFYCSGLSWTTSTQQALTPSWMKQYITNGGTWEGNLILLS